MRCDQLTRRNEQCERHATWIHLEKNNEWEGYCTQHANEYDPHRRGRKLGKRWKPYEPIDSDTFAEGDIVKFTKDSLGCIHLDSPTRFVEQVVGKDNIGMVVDPPGWTGVEGWILVHLEDDLYCPVHPSMVERYVPSKEA